MLRPECESDRHRLGAHFGIFGLRNDYVREEFFTKISPVQVDQEIAPARHFAQHEPRDFVAHAITRSEAYPFCMDVGWCRSGVSREDLTDVEAIQRVDPR